MRVSAATRTKLVKDGDREAILLSVDNCPSNNCSNEEEGKEDAKGCFSSLAGLLDGVVGDTGPLVISERVAGVALALSLLAISKITH